MFFAHLRMPNTKDMFFGLLAVKVLLGSAAFLYAGIFLHFTALGISNFTLTSNFLRSGFILWHHILSLENEKYFANPYCEFSSSSCRLSFGTSHKKW